MTYSRTLLCVNAAIDDGKQALRTAAVAHQNQRDACIISNLWQPTDSGSTAANQESNIENRESNTSKAFNNGTALLTPWAEIRIKTDEHIPNLRQTLLDVLAEVTEADGPNPPVELLRISQERLTPAPAAAPVEKKQLDELDPEEVFSGIVTADGYTPERATELLADFRNLRNWMNDTAE